MKAEGLSRRGRRAEKRREAPFGPMRDTETGRYSTFPEIFDLNGTWPTNRVKIVNNEEGLGQIQGHTWNNNVGNS